MWRMILCSMILWWAAAFSSVAQTGDAKKSHWAFQPVKRPSLPEVNSKEWIHNCRGRRPGLTLHAAASAAANNAGPSAGSVADRRPYRCEEPMKIIHTG